jgi:hypothetical protein
MKAESRPFAALAALAVGLAAAGCGSSNSPGTGSGFGGAQLSNAGAAATGMGGSMAPGTGGKGPALGAGGAAVGNGGVPSLGSGGAISGNGGATSGSGGAVGGGGAVGTSGASGSAGASGAAGQSGGGAGGGTGPGAGSCGPEATATAVDLGDPMKHGPWTPTSKAATGPTGASTLFYPMDLGKGGVLHPVFHWGCGAGSTPAQYADHLNQLASYGFVVIANASGSMPAKASLDWILAENDKMGSEFYQKLDPKRAGIGGHSLGALETFQAAADPRIGLYVLVCGGSGSGTTGAANIHAPSIFLGGEGESGTTNFEPDYAAITKAPSVFVTKTMTDHIYCARNNLAPWVAFMRWQFCGEDKWKAEFMANGTYSKTPWLASKSKGFM